MTTQVSRFESTMERIGKWVERYIAPPLLALGNQRHFNAIRGGLIRIIPLIIVGSLPLILTNLPFSGLSEAMKPYADPLNKLYTMTFGFIGMLLSLSVGAEMARMYKLEPIMTGVISLVCFLITNAPVDLQNNTMPIGFFSASGMFSALLIAVIVAEVMRFMRDKNLTIKMPPGVPENIAASFSALIPMFVLIVFFWILRVLLGFELTVLLNKIVSPLLVMSDTWYAVLLTGLLLMGLWFVGIHGGSLTIWGALYPFLVANLAENAQAAAAGLPIPHVFTEPFLFTYGIVGGTGMTLPLVLIWWKSRSARLRQVARLELGPGIFNINEPIVFGSPIVLNPLFFIPYVFGSTTLAFVYGYVLIRLGWVTAPYIQVPWTTPLLIQPYLSTGGDWRSVIAQAVIIVITGLIWLPFAKIWERRCIAEESAMNTTEAK